jgi:hypothetical protein
LFRASGGRCDGGGAGPARSSDGTGASGAPTGGSSACAAASRSRGGCVVARGFECGAARGCGAEYDERAVTGFADNEHQHRSW